MFKNHGKRIFLGPLKNATKQQKIKYLLLWAGRQVELIVTHHHQPNVDKDTVNTYFNLFEAHIHPIPKFRVERHKFHLVKQVSNEVIHQYLLKLCDCLREGCCPEAVQIEVLPEG